MMRRLVLTLALVALGAQAALAQSFPGQIPAFSIFGNPTSSPALLPLPLTGVLFNNTAIAVNATAGGCTQNPGVRGPIYVCNDIPGNNTAGQAAGIEIWIGSNPVGTPGANNPIGLSISIDNLNSRSGIWGTNTNCVQQNIAFGFGASAGIVHCNETNMVASIPVTTPLSGFSPGSVLHAYEAVCNQNGGATPQPCQVAFWAWAAGDYANNTASQFQPLNFGFAAQRIQYAGFDCEVAAGDTGTYFKQGCVWDQSNSAISYQVAGTHTSIIDAGAATYTQFANCNATCNFVGKVSSTGGMITTGNAGAVGLAASVVANATSGNSGFELQTAGIARAFLGATGTLVELYTTAAQPLKFGTNSTDAIVISGAQVIQLPAVATGTPAASLCIDSSNNIVKKTSAGSCI